MPLTRPVSNQQIALFLALKKAGVELDLRTFEQRLVLQKAVYLMQSAGVELGYHYRWYLRGPYSSGLTDDLFFLAGLAGDDKSQLAAFELDQPSQRKVEQIASLFQSLRPNELASQLELMASSLFLFRTRQARSGDAAETSRVLNAAGKEYSPDQVDHATQVMRGYGLVQN